MHAGQSRAESDMTEHIFMSEINHDGLQLAAHSANRYHKLQACCSYFSITFEGEPPRRVALFQIEQKQEQIFDRFPVSTHWKSAMWFSKTWPGGIHFDKKQT